VRNIRRQRAREKVDERVGLFSSLFLSLLSHLKHLCRVDGLPGRVVVGEGGHGGGGGGALGEMMMGRLG
jgi:hypothetical protein